MGDALKKAQTGKPLRIPARAYNAFIDAARAHQETDDTGSRPSLALPAVTVLVKNATESDQDRFAILGIDSPIILPEDNEEAFKNRVAFKGIVARAHHDGKFVILQEPIKAGELGLGLAQGASPVRIWIPDLAQEYVYALPQDGDTAMLNASSAPTSTQILWVEGGQTGEVWGIVKLGVRPETLYRTTGIATGKVTGVWHEYGVPWAGFATHGFITFVTVHPLANYYELLYDPEAVPEWDESVTLYIKASQMRDIGKPPVGYLDLQTDDVVGYVRDGILDLVPGYGANWYDGVLYPFAGPSDAPLGADYQVTDGPGIVVADDLNPPGGGTFAQKVSVELAENDPGLHFVEGAGDDGKLAVDPDAAKAITVGPNGVGVVADTAHGIEVSASGIAVDLASTNPGLDFDGTGDLKALADPNRAISINATGIGVVADTAHGIEVAINGVAVDLAATNPGLEFDGAGDLKVKLEPEKGLEFGAGGGVAVKIDPNGPLFLGASGLDLGVANLAGLGYDGSGNLKVLLDADDLEFHNGNVRHKKQTSGLEQIVIWQDGDKNLHVRVKKNGVWSPEGTELDLTFNDSGHTTDGWWD